MIVIIKKKVKKFVGSIGKIGIEIHLLEFIGSIGKN